MPSPSSMFPLSPFTMRGNNGSRILSPPTPGRIKRGKARRDRLANLLSVIGDSPRMEKLEREKREKEGRLKEADGKKGSPTKIKRIIQNKRRPTYRCHEVNIFTRVGVGTI